MTSELESRARPDDASTRVDAPTWQASRDEIAQAVELRALPDGPTGIAEFARRYYAYTADEDLDARGLEALVDGVWMHWTHAADRAPGTIAVRVFTPAASDRRGHSVVEIITDDMPFLVDSVTEELERHDVNIHLLVHPIYGVRRDGSRLLGLAGAGDDDAIAESFIRIEIDRTTEPDAVMELTEDLRRVLDDVAAATSDWQSMVAAMVEVIQTLPTRPVPVTATDLEETLALLEWMVDDNFTFLAFGDYSVVTDESGAPTFEADPQRSFGVARFRRDVEEAMSFARLAAPSDEQRPTLLTIAKASERATVHRSEYLDYVGIKRFDERGDVEGEWRFLGLWTSTAYHARARDIPLLRRKVADVIERAGFPSRSHGAKDLAAILDSYPRDELFQVDVDELYRIAMGILQLQERKRTKIFARRDQFGRFVTCIVYLPRERYNTDAREEIADLLVRAYGATGHEFQARVSESRLARLHFTLRTDPDDRHEPDVDELEAQIVATTRSWEDGLGEALVARHGEERGLALLDEWEDAFPVAYQADFSPDRTVEAIEEIRAIGAREGLRAVLSPPLPTSAGEIDFTLFVRGEGPRLSEVLPILGHMGVEVVDEHPYAVTPHSTGEVTIQRFGVRPRGPSDLDGAVRRLFEDCFDAVVHGRAENDGLNRLVLSVGLSWQEVAIVRAYSRYMRQCGTLFGQGMIADAVAAHAPLARQIVELFVVRFDPRLDASDRATRADALTVSILAGLDAVTSLDEDRILRALLRLVEATVRTNWFATPRSTVIAMKLDPALVPDLPLPLPKHEIWVYAPHVEGVHLRSDSVARGGIRWSDRLADFRTEVLGLMKAQTVKNTVIVPAGAKGGFVVKSRARTGERPPREEVVAAYRSFIGSLLDVCDNYVDGEAVTPEHVVRYDDDDVYIVAAADKGTATFSDIANEIALERGFWLGDAFASGGSVGYDHKKMGITARGAWESVRRHFRELGVDVDEQDFTVAGIGDMSGDVFGNAMLLSRHIRLVAAFDHRHVFLDPDPDPHRAFEERERLFALPRSSWADYDSARISPGGGVFRRDLKAVDVTPQVRARLGMSQDTTSCTPNELIRAILRAPVDLCWNGGIGTFVRATEERDADVGDKANDAVRVTAAELRCRVVAEGGNLGLTQLARTEFALRDGRVNTDFIDNSGGVDASDHEVNIKIALDAAVRAGELDREERDELFLSMTDDVAALVLRTNYRQNRAIANARAQSASMEDVHARYVRALELAGVLDRSLEFLPDEEAFQDRRVDGIGLSGPELAILLSYTKIALDEEIRASEVPDDPDFAHELFDYFPDKVRDRFHDAIAAHPLRRGIVSTAVVNRMVNAAGISFVFRMQEETGASVADVTRAHRVAREIFGLSELWTRIERLDHLVPAEVQTEMYLESRKLIERASRWFLRYRRRPLPVRTTLDFFGPGVRTLSDRLPDLLRSSERRAAEERAARLVEHGCPTDFARRISLLDPLYGALDIVDLALRAGLDVERVAAVYFALGERLYLDWVTDKVLALPRDDRWHALARTALRDDARAVHRELTSDVLSFSGVLDDTDGAVAGWLDANLAVAERALGVIDDIRSHNAEDLHTLTVALRELRNLAQPG